MIGKMKIFGIEPFTITAWSQGALDLGETKSTQSE
jgi:hypothetical protein